MKKTTTPEWSIRSLVLALGLACISPSLHAGDAENSLKSAQEYFDQAEYKSSVIELKNALQTNPSMAEARHLLGRVYLKTGQVESAEKELNRAKALGMQGTDFELDMAEVSLLRGDFEDVARAMSPGPEGNAAQRARVYALKARAQVGLKQYDEARESLSKGLTIKPDSMENKLMLVRLDLMSGDLDAVNKGLDDILNQDPNAIEAVLLRADLLRQENKAEEAVGFYKRAVKVQPNDPRAYLGMATSYLALSQPDQAETQIKAAEEIRGDLVMSQYLRGLLEFERKNLQASRNHLLQVLSAIPTHAPTLLLLGNISFKLEEYETAEDYITRHQANQPATPQISLQLAMIRSKLGKHEQVIEMAEPLLKEFPEDVGVKVLVGTSYIQTGSFDKGIEYLQQAVALAPDAPAVRTELAKALLAAGETDQAVGHLESVSGQETDQIRADVMLVLTYLANKRFDLARTAAEGVIAKKPKDPVSHNLLGVVYMAQNDNEKARQQFNKALSFDSGFIAAESNLAKMALKDKKLEEAEKRFNRVLEIDDKNASAMLGLAAVSESRGEKDAMIKQLETATENSPENPQAGILLATSYLNDKAPYKALRVVNDLSTRFPENTRVMVLQARAQTSVGEPNSAVRTLQRLVDQNDSMENLLLLASAQMNVKDMRGARQSLERAIAANPDAIRPKTALFGLAMRDRNTDEAIQIAKDIQSNFPEDSRGYEAEATVYFVNKDYLSAEKAYDKALKLNKSRLLILRIAENYNKQAKHSRSLQLLKDWLAENPDDDPVRYIIAQTHQQMGNRKEAIKGYEEIRNRGTMNAVTLNNLAWLYFVDKDKRAVDIARQAHEMSPDRPEISDTYGWILLNMGAEPQKALQLLQDALVKYPTNPEIGYHVAYALHKQGRDEEARRVLHRALLERQDFEDRPKAERLAKDLGL